MDLFDIAAKITLDTSEYEKDLSGAESKGSGFANKLKNGLKTGAKVGGAAIAAVGAGVGALGKSFYNGVSDLAAYGDQIDKNSQKMGISAQAYQEWDFILQHSGSSIDAMGRGMMTLSKQAENNSDAFERLGITQEDLSTLNKEDLFAKTIEGLQALGEGTERDALAAELFGGSAKELGPLLNTTADDVAAMRKQVNDLGGVLSDDAVKDAAAFQDAMQNMNMVINGIKRSFLKDFLPAATKVSNGLTKLFSGDKIGGLEEIKNGIDEFVDNLSEKLPDFIEVGWGLIEGLLQAINDNLPMLVERGADIILNGIIPGILEQLPSLVETAFSIIAQLVSSIGEALPELIPAAVSIIIQIVESLLDNIDLLIDAAISLIMGLADGIISAIPILLEKAPEIVIKLVSAIIRNAPKLFEAAAQLIGKLGEGIGKVFSVVLGWGMDIVSKIWEGIKTTWENVKTWGKNIFAKIGEGISNAWTTVKNWGISVISKVWEGIKTTWENVKSWGQNIFNKIGEGISNAWETVKNWGKDLIRNLWNGISSMGDWFKGKLREVGGWIKDILGFSEPKEGPLSNFHTFAPDMMKLFMKGIDDSKGKLLRTVEDAFDFKPVIFGEYGVNANMNYGAVDKSKYSRPIYLVLDSGELVGRTVEKYDEALGTENAMQLRWEGLA